MTARARARAAVDRVPVPAETLVGGAAGVLLQRARPRPLPRGARPAGVVCVVGGLALVVAAWRGRGAGSLEDPSSLVTTGLHAVSRNPMYVGFTATHLGLAGMTRNGWTLVTCPASAAVLLRSVLRGGAVAERTVRECVRHPRACSALRLTAANPRLLPAAPGGTGVDSQLVGEHLAGPLQCRERRGLAVRR